MVSITWNRMQFMDWYQLHGIGCNWRTSSNSIISFTIELESKNTLASIAVSISFTVELGIKEYIDIKWFLFNDRNRNHWQSLRNNKKHFYGMGCNWSLKEQLIWNNILGIKWIIFNWCEMLSIDFY